MEYILLENHFWVPNNEIRSITRNKSWEDLSIVIQEIASIIYPDVQIEILFLPPEIWSYKDTIKIVWATLTVISTIWMFAFQILQYKDSHDEHMHNEKNWSIDDTKKCIEFKKMIEEYKKDWLNIEGVQDDKINQLCWNIKIKKSKNDFVNTLKKDDMISNSEILLLKSDKTVVRTHNIERTNFDDYIEYVPENEEHLIKDIKWTIELISPVIRQKKEWKWIPWKGVFYWDDIKKYWFNVLSNWEQINFYMQDEEFKKQIYNHSVTFWSGDNIKTVFDLKYTSKIDLIQNKHIYIKEVKSINDEIFEYKEKAITKSINKDEILTLF